MPLELLHKCRVHLFPALLAVAVLPASAYTCSNTAPPVINSVNSASDYGGYVLRVRFMAGDQGFELGRSQ
jgi:hypothetical protein